MTHPNNIVCVVVDLKFSGILRQNRFADQLHVVPVVEQLFPLEVDRNDREVQVWHRPAKPKLQKTSKSCNYRCIRLKLENPEGGGMVVQIFVTTPEGGGLMLLGKIPKAGTLFLFLLTSFLKIWREGGGTSNVIAHYPLCAFDCHNYCLIRFMWKVGFGQLTCSQLILNYHEADFFFVKVNESCERQEQNFRSFPSSKSSLPLAGLRHSQIIWMFDSKVQNNIYCFFIKNVLVKRT